MGIKDFVADQRLKATEKLAGLKLTQKVAGKALGKKSDQELIDMLTYINTSGLGRRAMRRVMSRLIDKEMRKADDPAEFLQNIKSTDGLLEQLYIMGITQEWLDERVSAYNKTN